MVQIVIGNVIALIASIIMVYSGYLKEKKKILYTQTIQIVLLALSNIILGGITGAINNAINCIRNILCYKEKLNIVSKIILIVLATILSICFNNLGFIGILPLISSISYILLMNTKDILKFKYLIIFTMLLWLVHDIYIKSHTSAIFDFLTVITNLVSIIQIRKGKIEIIKR